MNIPIYLGRGRSLYGRAKGNKTKRTIEMKTEEANHMLFLGGSGFGKTTIMRSLVEEIWSAYRESRIAPIMFVFERKIDVSKAEKIREIYYTETRKYSLPQLNKKYGENTWKYIKQYVELMNKYPNQYGSPGDFAMGMPNILGKYTMMTSNTTMLGYFGLIPFAYPVNRYVFRPRRDLKYIKIDNGWKTEVIDAKIKYNSIDFQFIEKLTHVGSGALHGERLRKLWDIEKIRDPEKVLEKALKLETSEENPSRTYMRIEETIDRLQKDKLFSKDETFFKYISNNRINVIDFSQNSDLTTEEENLIFKMIVDSAVNTAFKLKIPIFFVVDEIQHFANNPVGLSAINKIYREGRSMGINLIGATQYMAGLNKSLIEGCTHIGIVGKIASPDDLKMLKKMIPGVDEDDIGMDETYSIDEYHKQKRQNKFKGYFAHDKQFIERITYRHPQSL
jgi:energy-coupling factor transporter ATP-binding protein EcfA2